MNIIQFALTTLTRSFGPPQPELPEATNEAAALVRRLQSAKTIGDVYSLPFPLSLGEVAQGRAFVRPPDVMKAKMDSRGRFGAGLFENLCLDPIFGQASRFTAAFNNRVSKNWRAEVMGFMRDVNAGTSVHFDFPEANPRDIVQVRTSSSGTNVLPHDRALDIIERSPLAGLLDVRIDGQNMKYEMSRFYIQLRRPDSQEVLRTVRLMHDAMVPMPAKAINVWTGITVHQRPAYVDPARTCYKAVTKYGGPNGPLG